MKKRSCYFVISQHHRTEFSIQKLVRHHVLRMLHLCEINANDKSFDKSMLC